MLTRGDFHIHSTASDGDLTPSELVLYAKERGIDTIAIADHNSTGGISEAAAAGSQYGVAVIPSIELSTKYKGESIHLLGYFKNNTFYNKDFQEILRFIRTHRFAAARNIINIYMNVINSSSSLSVNEGISLLRTFGASVVLAHPVRISTKNLNEILNFQFDGLEAKYCGDSYSDENYFTNIALNRYSFYTAGSDFHSKKKYHGVHCNLGEPSLNSIEIALFLHNSNAAVLN